ncbi:MAG: M20/M25/M40 family metallo-hydrolase [Bacteroidales bacterium]|jgi:hypothetical protein|nr:M20/M25/M40 family metallo-hydrolase [Bacteroidales bacterium]
MKKVILFLSAILLTLNIFSQTMKESVYFLASDELEGRFPMSKGDSLARKYIVETFLNNKIVPITQNFTFSFKPRLAEEKIELQTANIYGIIRGNDHKLKDEYVVIGAHFDHLGKNNTYSMRNDSTNIHYGADDNASGVAMMLEMAGRLSKGNYGRSLIFVAFAAEEEGLNGSKFFVENMPVNKDNVVAMFNFDMVGKFRNNTINAGGIGTSLESEAIVRNVAKEYNLNVKLSSSGIGASDHSSFYASNIPVFFIHTDADTTYHTPSDKPQYINYSGMDTIADFSFALIENVLLRENRLTFQRSIDPQNTNPSRMKVSLGIMPDHSGTANGVKVDVVSKNRAADRAGIKQGDIIIEINNKKVGDLYEYMEAFSNVEQGETIDVKLIREGKEIVIKVKM